MWTTKYEPTNVGTMILDDNVKRTINTYIKNEEIPNIIFVGVSGIGKTTIIKCIMNEIYGNIRNIADYVCNVNKLLEKHTKNVFELLELFCKRTVENNKYQKVVIVDNVDDISIKLQNSIATCMEKYKKVGFIFTCNDLKIVEILQSICVIMYIQRPNEKDVCEYIKNICRMEKYKYDEDGINKLCFLSQCDIRYTINIMQIICQSFGEITSENINKISDIPDTVVLNEIINHCMENNCVAALRIVKQLDDKGYLCSDVLCGLFDIIKLPNTQIPEDIKMKFLTIIARTRYDVSRKLDSILQLEKCIIKLCEK